jgi:putative transposase
MRQRPSVNLCAKATKLIFRQPNIFTLHFQSFYFVFTHGVACRYDVLLVPKLGTKDMTLCAGRKLKTKVVRQMLTLGHSYIFSRLKEKCSEYGTVFLEVKEHYTSQTCLSCGKLNKCGEAYACRSCGFHCDRDIVGAAGIFLKAVRKTNPSP